VKIYNKVVINMITLETISEDSFEYHGSIALCKQGDVNTEDHEFNMGMLDISQQQQGMATQMFNQFRYGVDYDPNETVTGTKLTGDRLYDRNKGVYHADTGKWVKGEIINASEYIKDEDGKLVEDSFTVGERKGYNPDAVTSESEYMQEIINKNAGLLPLQNYLENKTLNSQVEQLNLTNDQTASAREIIRLGNEKGLPEAAINSQLSQLGLSDAQAQSAMRLLPSQEKLSLTQNESEQALTEKLPTQSILKP